MHSPATSQIWLIRHAESEANVQRIYANTGRSFPLTKKGLEQVRAMADRFSAFNISAVYTSPLLRAMQTAEELCRPRAIQIHFATELTEYNMGIYEGTGSMPGTAGAISDAETKRRWFEQSDLNARSPGGESLRDMKGRFLPFMTKLAEDHLGMPGIVLVITHGGLLSAMLPFVFENLDRNFVGARFIEHLSVIKGELRNDKLVCVEYDGDSAIQ
jgi:broad specificity phosphatase PhoE